MQQVNKKAGQSVVQFLSGDRDRSVETDSTGILTLDLALGGGLPKGRVIEIYGPESSGKTTLALQAIASTQARDGIAALIDAEHALDPGFAKRLGVNLDDLMHAQPESGEQALDLVENLIRSGAVDIIAVDSVSALVPRSELEGEIGQGAIGGQARLMSNGLRRIAAASSQFKCTVIFINQLRNKIGVLYGNPETTSGGKALAYYASVRIDVRRKEQLGTKDDYHGIRVKAKIVKNKVAPPYRLAEFDILFQSGIDTVGCLVDAAESADIVNRRGAYYFYQGENIGQGRNKTVEYLKENPQVEKEIYDMVRAKVADGFTAPIATSSSTDDDQKDILGDDQASVDGLELEDLPQKL